MNELKKIETFYDELPFLIEIIKSEKNHEIVRVTNEHIQKQWAEICNEADKLTHHPFFKHNPLDRSETEPDVMKFKLSLLFRDKY